MELDGLLSLIHGRSFYEFISLTIRKSETTSSCESSTAVFWYKWVVACQWYEFPLSGNFSVPWAIGSPLFRMYPLPLAERILLKYYENLSG